MKGPNMLRMFMYVLLQISPRGKGRSLVWIRRNLLCIMDCWPSHLRVVRPTAGFTSVLWSLRGKRSEFSSKRAEIWNRLLFHMLITFEIFYKSLQPLYVCNCYTSKNILWSSERLKQKIRAERSIKNIKVSDF